MQVTCRLHAGYIQAGKDYKRFSELSNHRLSSSMAANNTVSFLIASVAMSRM